MKRFLRLLLVLGLISAMAAAQETPRHLQKIYKVVFLIYELEDGKKINQRTYTLPVNTVDGNTRDSSIRVGTRVPITTGSSGNNTQVTYIDVGLNLDCNVTEQEGKFILHGSLDLSSFAMAEQGAGNLSKDNPVLRNIKQTFTTVVGPGVTTPVTSMDDVNSKKRLQVDVTVTKIE